MDSIGWSESWIDVYASPKTRKEFANKGDLAKIIKDIGEGMAKEKRNLKERFFEQLLKRKEDGFLIICLIDKLSNDFEKSEVPSPLKRILDEWERQSQIAETPDTLFYVLSKMMVEPETPIYLKCALTMQSRRVRKGSNVNNRNRRVARRLIRQAEKIHVPENLGRIREFASVPLEHFDLWVELQAMLCDARFSNWKNTVEKAKALHFKIERHEESLRKHAHRPDIWLKWWTWDVRHRAAAVCRDRALFTKSREKMRDLKKQSKGNLKGYFDEGEGRDLDSGYTDSENPSSHKELQTVDQFIDSWVKFDKHWEEAVVFRRGGSRGASSSWEDDDKKKKWYDDFSKGLQGLNEYFLYGAPGRPKFVKHSYSTSKKQKRDRSKKILAEISHARMMLALSDTHLYCYLLEILHRLLVYRMWWESINYSAQKEDVQVDKISPCFEPGVAAGILKDIRRDMRLKHINNRWEREINSSIACFNYLDGDRESEPEDVRDVRGAAPRLRDLLDVMKKRGERYFLETNYDKEEAFVCSIYGIPYCPEDGDAFDFMNPNRRPTGWTTPEIEVRETLD